MRRGIVVWVCLALFSCDERVSPRVLVFTKMAGVKHDCISSGKRMIMELGKKYQFEVDTTSNASYFSDSTLSKYKAVVFLNTTGELLDDHQQTAFEKFIRAGNGFVGIHGAADAEYEWSWYGNLVGAYFRSHSKVLRALFQRSSNNILTSDLPDNWYRTEEVFNFQKLPENVSVLFTVEPNSFEGSEHPEGHPVAWYHNFDGGRSFYTSMGHTEDAYNDSFFQQHVLKGIQFAIMDNP